MIKATNNFDKIAENNMPKLARYELLYVSTVKLSYNKKLLKEMSLIDLRRYKTRQWNSPFFPELIFAMQ